MPCTDLRQLALKAFNCQNPQAKVEQTRALWQALQQQGHLALDCGAKLDMPLTPGRPSKPLLVAPKALPKRSLGTLAGRIALIHAIAHIEFNAINLALDAIGRFTDMPAEFYHDWAFVANDEARHFTLLNARLAELGHHYGDFPAHDGLWEMAQKTAPSDLARMALVPRVLEARGLDVTPGMMAKFRQQQDQATVGVLAIILHEEVRHVKIGTRWFHWCCRRDGLAPEATFKELLLRYMRMPPRGPYNLEARTQAGFSANELTWLSHYHD